MGKGAMPLVTVLMPAYNNAAYLSQAVESILNQTFRDFELLIIDDGSTDKTRHVLQQFTDPRIIYVANAENLGLIRTLNRGLSLARGTYIARMDADDICLPERLEKQVAFLEQHPEVGIVSSRLALMDPDGKPWHGYNPFLTVPTEPNVVRWRLFFHCCVVHGVMMVRRTIFEQLGGYCEEFAHAEDYELFLRAGTFTKIANLPDIHLYYRQHGESVSYQFTLVQQENSLRAKWQAAEALMGTPIAEEVVHALFSHPPSATTQQFHDGIALLLALYQTYLASTVLTEQENMLIQQDVLTRLTALTAKHLRVAPLNALWIWQKGVRLIADRCFNPYAFLLGKLWQRLTGHTAAIVTNDT